MSFSLLELESGRLSLEFAPADVELLRALIVEMYGTIRRRWFAAAAEVTIGGERFVFQDEWDDPCLIALTRQGADMLRRLYQALSAA